MVNNMMQQPATSRLAQHCQLAATANCCSRATFFGAVCWNIFLCHGVCRVCPLCPPAFRFHFASCSVAAHSCMHWPQYLSFITVPIFLGSAITCCLLSFPKWPPLLMGLW